MEYSALNYILLLICLSVPAVWALRYFHLPPLLGYLAVGIIISPHAMALIPGGMPLGTLAEIGLVFLLFMLGLEFSASRLIAMRRTVFGLGAAQVFISSLTGGLLIWWIGASWQTALVVGGILALSSTAIVVQQLSEQREIQTRYGQLAIGILLFQDLAVVPLLVVIPILGSGGATLAVPITLAIVKGLIALLLMYVAGHYLLHRFFHQVVSKRSPELFTLATLMVALTAAWVTYQLGLSLVLGAFLAGIMLSETEYRQRIELDIRPFRDVLMGIFFISVGTRFNWGTVYAEYLQVGLLAAGLVVGKATVIAMLTRLYGYEHTTAVRTGIVLGQGGEFGFAVLLVALQHNLLTPIQSQIIIAAIILSMLATPLLIRFSQPITSLLVGGTPRDGEQTPARSLSAACEDMEGHVVICGFGRIGRNLALFLRDNKILHIALELEQSLIKAAWESGDLVFYGDCMQRSTMLKARVGNAHAVVITCDDVNTTRHTIKTVRKLVPELPIIVRSHHDRNTKQLLAAGATNVVPESFESSMMLAKRVLEQVGVSAEKALEAVETARKDEYQRIKAAFHSQT